MSDGYDRGPDTPATSGHTGRVEGVYDEGRSLSLSNSFLTWKLRMTGGTVQSVGLHNKLSGRHYDLLGSRELLLTFSGAASRLDIPWWNVLLEPGEAGTSPEEELGIRSGYQSEAWTGDEDWNPYLNLLLRGTSGVTQSLLNLDPEGRNRSAAVFPGYAWFRQRFHLRQDWAGEPVAFCLGGYNQEDWNEYWVYVNGVEVDHWTASGRWRTPRTLTLVPGSPAYGALRFGDDNLLAIRTREIDRRVGGLPPAILDRALFDGILVDQSITIGPPYHLVSDFQLTTWWREGGDEQPEYVFALRNEAEGLELTLHYALEGYTRRKWFELTNTGDRERLLLDVDLDQFGLGVPVTDGDFGFPVIAAEEIFGVIEHPAGLSQGVDGRIHLRHFPGRTLEPAGTFTSKVSIVGVAPEGQGKGQFREFIRARSPRHGLLSIYDPFGINGMPDDPNWTLDDRGMLETMDLLETWQRRGIFFDYYVPDVGWQDRAGDLTRFWAHGFPEGPRRVIRRANDLGMKWGLWFASTGADWNIGLNPTTAPSRTLAPGLTWPAYRYRDGFDYDNWSRGLCLASEPYGSMLRDALLYHIRELHLRFFKLDVGFHYYCQSQDHDHLPGKYSMEASLDRVIEIATATRRACPDLYIMWYWGLYSPLMLLYGDSIFDKRITLEAASTGDYPTLFFRDGVTLALDQAAHYADFIPPMCSDSLGVWITGTWWGNVMNKERWQEAAVMDLGRGNLLFPQLWGDLRMLNEADVAFLARLQKLAKDNEAILQRQTRILGSPWNNDVYGYAYCRDAHGFVFMNNAHFQSRQVHLCPDASIGLEVPAGTRLRLLTHFPEEAELRQADSRPFMVGEAIDVWLRPFEVAMWEVVPEDDPRVATYRPLPVDAAHVSHRLAFAPTQPMPDLVMEFGDPTPYFRSTRRRPTLAEFARLGYHKRVLAWEATIPQLATGGHVLAIIVRMHQDGQPWRHPQPADLMQMRGMVGDRLIRFEPVPNFRQTENNQRAHWLVFKIRTASTWAGKLFHCVMTTYLPPSVILEEEGWIVPEWRAE